MSAVTAAGLIKFRPVKQGSRIALVAPASSFDRAEFDAGVAELKRLGLEPVWNEKVFEKDLMRAGRPRVRVMDLLRAIDEMDADAVMSVRGGYGSMELLPLLDQERIRRARTAFVGYSDVTSLHSFLGGNVGMASVHGPMIEGRLAKGTTAYDPATFLKSLSAEPLGELAPEGLEMISPGTTSPIAGPLVGGTLTQLLASLGTPFEFRPPDNHVLFLDEVNERPYRLHRMLTQLVQTGRLANAAAVVFGQLPGCDEPGGTVRARDVIRDALLAHGNYHRGPILLGFPSGHTTSALISLPFGVRTVVVPHPYSPKLILEEAAAA